MSNFFDPNVDSDADTLGMSSTLPSPIHIVPHHSSDTLEDDSPYPEVRSAVANYDDDTMPVSTIRAWVLGICWAIVLPGVNQFFYMRYPSIVLGGVGFLYQPTYSNFPLTPRLAACCAISSVPCGSCMGTSGPLCEIFWSFFESGTIYDKRTCESTIFFCFIRQVC
jgi:hypothetical protein